MIKQDWMVIVAGEKLVDRMSAETMKLSHNGYGYDSNQLCELQRKQAAQGILGVEIVYSMFGHSVRYDSGLQGFNLLARSKELGGTLEAAIEFCKNWVAADPDKRYAWYRK